MRDRPISPASSRRLQSGRRRWSPCGHCLKSPDGVPSLQVPSIRNTAGAIAWGFRTLFNLPEVTTMLRRGRSEHPYWRQVLDYCLEGGLQPVMESPVHVLQEWEGVAHKPIGQAVRAVGQKAAEALQLRTAAVGVDSIDVAQARSNWPTTACGRVLRRDLERDRRTRGPAPFGPMTAYRVQLALLAVCAVFHIRRTGSLDFTFTAMLWSIGTCQPTQSTSSNAKDGCIATKGTPFEKMPRCCTGGMPSTRQPLIRGTKYSKGRRPNVRPIRLTSCPSGFCQLRMALGLNVTSPRCH